MENFCLKNFDCHAEYVFEYALKFHDSNIDVNVFHHVLNLF